MPQEPPQPSGPHARLMQLGAQAHCPAASQPFPGGQEPQLPPHPSGPHTLPEQEGVQHWPAAVQVIPAEQLPHEVPQPSKPHALPVQLVGLQH